MITATSVVSPSGVELQYIDTGAPSKASYVTLFAVHGMYWNSRVFQKIQPIAHARGIRVVAVTRRGFPGSTPFTPSESATVRTGSTASKNAWMDDRGRELATLVSNFIKDEQLPALSKDGKTGGVALFGWSLGVPFVLNPLVSTPTLPADVRKRFCNNLRAVLLYEPGTGIAGLPTPSQYWSPAMDTALPASERYPAYVQWMTAYFQHGNLSTRDTSVLSYWVPSAARPPSIFTDPTKMAALITSDPNSYLDQAFLSGMQAQLRAYHRTAMFDPSTRALFPNMTMAVFSGERSPSWGPAAFWQLEDEAAELGAEGRVAFKVLPGSNHFMHWDNPEGMVDVIQEYLGL
ncbi:Alpha/Beta hydrolase protein [Amylostereum chailletii]|nr:Alpha/Beta hydrolase protein [Amylostereum chailletii]